MSRYTPPSDGNTGISPYRRRSLSVRIGVWVLLIGIVAFVFGGLIAALV